MPRARGYCIFLCDRAQCLGMNIQAAIVALGSDREAARKLRVHRSTASRLRRGVVKPSYAVMERLRAITEGKKERRNR